jgi:two-component system response regulator PfeR
MSGRILIIDDDMAFGEQVVHLLNKKGFEAKQCVDGEKGLLSAISNTFDLILLDVLLPSINGFSVLKQLRQVKQTPVMMVTASGAESERIQGYEKGADDYISKPCSFTEMLLRIEAILRRSYPKEDVTDKNKLITIDSLQLQKSNQQATYDEHIIELTPIQFRLLWVLADNQYHVLNKPYLYQAVLERAFSRYDRSLDMHLSRLKRKLNDVGWRGDRLKTIHGKGYSLK